MDAQDQLQKANIIPDISKDQFFLVDNEIIHKIVEFADLNKKDVVLEIGAGVGNLTAELARKAGRVITFEIDQRYKPFLDKMPRNVEVHMENAWEYVQLHGKWRKKKIYNKIVSNLPYSFVEQFLHNITFLDYDKAILLVPAKLVSKIKNNDVFGSFFDPKVLFDVPKEKFYPVPKTNSLLIDLVKLPDPIETRNLGRFLRQYMYKHEDQMVKNSLMEGLIKYRLLINSDKLTKNEAREIIKEKDLPTYLLERHPHEDIYSLVEEKFSG